MAMMPPIPATPKPGMTNISRASATMPMMNTMITHGASVPVMTMGIKYRMAATVATAAAKPMPGVCISM